MDFVREKISKEDFDKYQIGHYDERIPNGLIADSSYWAIDRERNIYLVTASSGGREPETLNDYRFIFYVDGDVYIINMTVTLEKIGEKYILRDFKQRFWNFFPYFSSNENPKRSLDEVADLFKEAMIIYRTSYDDDLTYKTDLTFDF